MAAPQTTFTYELNSEQQEKLLALLSMGNYRPRTVPYALVAVEGDGFNCALYQKEKHGRRKLCIQGGKAQDFVEFFLEPNVLGVAQVGYEDVLSAEELAVGGDDYEVQRQKDERDWAPHAGCDESGKGDFFGPLVACCVYVDESLKEPFKNLGVRDCKAMSDAEVLRVGRELRRVLGPERFSLVRIGNPAYNRMYFRIRNLNRQLSWAHATAIEELLGKQPACGRVVVDKYTRMKGEDDDPKIKARTEAVLKRALKDLGKAVAAAGNLDQHPKAEANPAVAAASVIAREEFLRALAAMATEEGPIPVDKTPLQMIPKGSSDPRVRQLAEEKVRKHGPNWLMNHCKAHFQTTDKVLAACGLTRRDLPPEGQVTSAAKNGEYGHG